MEILDIRPARPDDMPEVRAMLSEYVAWIGLDLAFQEIDAELDGLPGEYVPPRGALFVVPAPCLSAEARSAKVELAAMIAFRPIDGTICEMKRLFVRPEARGRGLARRLITHALDEARTAGYAEMRLDTLPMMVDAQKLYVKMGFADIEPYYETPIAGTRFMAKRL